MATPHRGCTPLRLIVAAITAITTALVVTPVVAHGAPAGAGADKQSTTRSAAGTAPTAKPSTSAQARTQLDTLRQNLEIVTESYNRSTIALAARKTQYTRATQTLGTARHKITALQGQVKQIAVSTYTGGDLTSFETLVSQGSPGDFLARLSALDLISKNQHDVFQGLEDSEHVAQNAERNAKEALAGQRKSTHDLSTKKTWILGHIGTLKTQERALALQEKREREAKLLAARQRAERIHKAALEAQRRLEEQRKEAEAAATPKTTAAETTAPKSDEPTEAPTTEAPSEAPTTTDAPSEEPTTDDPTTEATKSEEPTQTTSDDGDNGGGGSSGESSKAAIAVATAKAQLGKPYVWAADGPDAFDCSGLTMYAWAAAGVSLPHSSADQINYGTRVSLDNLEPGDLIFYYSPIHHVGMYVGNGMIIHASTEGEPVKYGTLEHAPIAGASRPG